jgi:hypothetical protein
MMPGRITVGLGGRSAIGGCVVLTDICVFICRFFLIITIYQKHPGQSMKGNTTGSANQNIPLTLLGEIIHYIRGSRQRLGINALISIS